MDFWFSVQQALVSAWQPIWSGFLNFLPSLVGAIIVFGIGLLIASWVSKIVESILKAIHLEQATQNIGLESLWKKAEMKLTTTQIISVLVKWFLILVFFIAAVDILGLVAVSVVLRSFLGYIPNVVAAVLIFAAGFLVANLVEGVTRGTLATVDHEAARPVGKLARWVVLVVAFFAAISELKVAQELVSVFLSGLTWTIVLSVGLAVGFGAKDLVSRILTDWYDKLKR